MNDQKYRISAKEIKEEKNLSSLEMINLIKNKKLVIYDERGKIVKYAKHKEALMIA